jgi:hypothetical protein
MEVSGKIYYISQAGNDLTGDGSNSSPWKSLSVACRMVNKPGDTIFVTAGVYNETVTSRLGIGVSLTGEGNNSVITSTTLTAEWTPLLDLRSALLVDGFQTISYLKFDGNLLKAAQALWIAKRKNVEIHHCTFIDFHYVAILWVGDGGDSGSDPYDNPIFPTNYVTGSKFYNNLVTNCSLYDSYGRGALYIGGHEGMQIYGNTITQEGRVSGSNGYPVKIAGNGGFMKGLKIYNNTIKKTGDNWGFAIESFFMYGTEIYGNNITGAIDVNYIEKRGYDYGLFIHDNNLGPETAVSYEYSGIILEFGVEDVIIDRNHFRNCAVGIFHTMRYPKPWVLREKIRYNRFSNTGNGSYHSAIRFGETSNDFDINDLEIDNNVFHTEPKGGAYFGLHIRGFRTASNIKIRNNIFINFSYYWFESNRGNFFDGLNVQNNILYNNANSNNISLSGSPKNYTNSGNVNTNPDFSSELNFHLKPGSKAIGAGLNIPGLLFDPDGVPISNPPNIGCYETIADHAVPVYKSSVIDNSNPQVITVTFDQPLMNIIPDKNFFEVNVNLQNRAITSTKVIGGKVQITLNDTVSYGDHVTISYTIPDTNPLQSVNNVPALSFNNLSVLNNVKLKRITKDLSMIIYSNPVKDSFTFKIDEEIPETISVLRISSQNGTVVFEKSLSTDMLRNKISVNLQSGLYIAQLLSQDRIVGICKLVVIK